MSVRTRENRVVNWTGTVHYAERGRPACGEVATSSAWMNFTIATVTCKRCIAKFGEDEPGHVEPEVDLRHPSVVQRAAERLARRQARERKER